MLFTQLFEDDFNKKKLNEVDPRNYDSDEDYYNAVRNQGKQQFSGDWDVWDEIASLENQLRYEKSDAARYQLHKQIDQLKRDNDIEDEEDEYEKEYDAELSKNKGVAEGSGNWYVRVKGKVLKDKKFDAIPFPSQESARLKAMEIHNKKRIPLTMIKLTRSWMDGPETQGVAEGSETAADIDKKIEFHKQGQAAAQYKGSMNKMHAAKIRELEAKKQALKPGVAEADKKKEDEPEVRDVALQRAISRAKGDFPAAGSGLEALAKDFMRSQDQDQKSLDQLQRAEQQQDQMLSQINKIDQEQEQEIQDLEQQNSTLAQRLQQLQNVNSQLEKKLASMSGRKQKRLADKSEPVPTIASEPSTATAAPAPTTQPEPAPKSEPTTSRAIGQVAKTLAAPTASPAFDRISQELQPRQKELGFDEPVTLKPKKYDTSRAADVDYRELTSKLARDIASDPDRARAFKPSAVKGVAGQQEMPVEGKEESARIRAVKRQRADGSVETTYELVNARGVTVKTGMSKETALSHLKHYKQKYGQ